MAAKGKGHSQRGFQGARSGLPPGMKLSVPYNHRADLLESLSEISEHLAYLYLPFHPGAALSARVFSGAASAGDYAFELAGVSGFCADTGIGMNLVANAPAWAVDPRAVVAAAARFKGEVPRLKVTFADLLVAREVRKLAPWMEIAVSCLADVQTPVQARWWREQAGATHLTVSREINRRIDRLAALADCGMILSMVSFDDCVPGCQLRGRHFVPRRPGHRGTKSLGSFVASCDPGNIEVRLKRPWLLAQKEVLPGHLKHLAGKVSEIKVSGRDQDTPEVIRRIRLYLEGSSLSHPNGYYTEPPGAWEKLATCDRNCPSCTWCEQHITKPAEENRLSGRSARPSASERADWSGSFVTPTGAQVSLWIEPAKSERPPFRVVSGLGIYYANRGAVQLDLVETLVMHVAGFIPDSPEKFRPEALDAALERSPLPGGFRLKG